MSIKRFRGGWAAMTMVAALGLTAASKAQASDWLDRVNQLQEQGELKFSEPDKDGDGRAWTIAWSWDFKEPRQGARSIRWVARVDCEKESKDVAQLVGGGWMSKPSGQGDMLMALPFEMPWLMERSPWLRQKAEALCNRSTPQDESSSEQGE